MSDPDALDLVVIGPSSVAFCGQQIGCGIEETDSFRMAVGPGAAAVAIGLARLGLTVGVITEVGDDPFGRFLRRCLACEGVEATSLRVAPERATTLSVHGARGEDRSGTALSGVCDGCGAMDGSWADGIGADGAWIDRLWAPRARAVLLTGTPAAGPWSVAALRQAIAPMRDQGGRVILDLASLLNPSDGVRAGPDRDPFASAASILPECDLLFAGGSPALPGTLRSLAPRALRSLAPRATVACWHAADGCRAVAGEGADGAGGEVRGRTFAVERCNPSAGYAAAMAGFLRGWLRGDSLATCATDANACAALATSRPAGAGASPLVAELDTLASGRALPCQPRLDPILTDLHRTGLRRQPPSRLLALACDHRMQLERIADMAGAPRARISDFKLLAVSAAAQVAAGRPGFGMFLDGRYGLAALHAAAVAGLWIARPVERTGSRPLEFEGGADGTADGSLGAQLVEWPLHQVVKALCFYHPDDSDALKARQLRELLRAQDACRRLGRDLLIEIIAGKHGALSDGTAAGVLQTLYGEGVKPDWWKLEPQPSSRAWDRIGDVIGRSDPHCQGVLMLGLDAPLRQLETAFAAVSTPWVRGFAIGRSIFSAPAQDWLSGAIDDEQAVAVMAERFAELVAHWERCRGASQAGGEESGSS
ncbi:MAG: DUF2090 domain-containing protein [Telmatospirillum sp.]|nr:DUF2090 domain-containing protein [Telmatospirillum sp.]